MRLSLRFPSFGTGPASGASSFVGAIDLLTGEAVGYGGGAVLNLRKEVAHNVAIGVKSDPPFPNEV